MKRVHNPRFVREYEEFREHYAWFQRRNEAGDLSISDSKEAVAEIREFVDRWAGRTGLAEMDEALRGLGAHVTLLENTLERDALQKLLAVLEARGDVVLGEMMVKTNVVFLDLMKHAPEEMRPELLKIHRESMGRDFDPEIDYRECEEDADANRREFEQAWQQFAADWPERVTPELRERVHTVEGEPLGNWKRELLTKMDELARAVK
jgi:hypothetical protein